MKRLSVVVAVFSVLALLLGDACERASTPTSAPTEAPVTSSLAESKQGAKVIGIPPAGQLYHGVYLGAVSGEEEDDITPPDVSSYEQLVGKS